MKLLILFKLLSIPSIHSGITTQFNQLNPIGKDVFYKLRNSSFTPWRRLLYRQAKQCIDKLQAPQGDVYKPWTLPCFIVDDTDLPKRGKCMERIGRIYSHLTGKYLLGYKCLNLALWNGASLFHLDFSLHIEMGKIKTRDYSKRN